MGAGEGQSMQCMNHQGFFQQFRGEGQSTGEELWETRPDRRVRERRVWDWAPQQE